MSKSLAAAIVHEVNMQSDSVCVCVRTRSIGYGRTGACMRGAVQAEMQIIFRVYLRADVPAGQEVLGRPDVLLCRCEFD